MTDEVVVLIAVWAVLFGLWFELRSFRKWMEKQTEDK